jgi:2-polyprenyl-3-methyl-5-hydroxy-6-metoxy-1,4-benzoquinol methylase
MATDEGRADSDLNRHYFLDLAAAYVRGKMPDAGLASPEALFNCGREGGLRLHRFKRTTELPRVRRVLGILRALDPCNLLDIGSGRGVFLWPLLDAFPELPITALDRASHRVADLEAIARGGITRLTPIEGDVGALSFGDSAFDVVTILEVLEHLPRPEIVAREVLRVARRAVIASVPSKPDENPEHLRLFTAGSLAQLFLDAASTIGRMVKVRCEFVLNHIVAVASIR